VVSDLVLARVGRSLFPWRPDSSRVSLFALLRALLPGRVRRGAAAGLTA
jgi:hypothetical protein